MHTPKMFGGDLSTCNPIGCRRATPTLLALCFSPTALLYSKKARFGQPFLQGYGLTAVHYSKITRRRPQHVQPLLMQKRASYSKRNFWFCLVLKVNDNKTDLLPLTKTKMGRIYLKNLNIYHLYGQEQGVNGDSKGEV